MPADAPEQDPKLSPAERRAKREARRAEQRRQNVGRAAKMHLARLAATRSVAPLRLPNDLMLPRINVGCSGWFYWHWRGSFYPAELAGSQWFPRYADAFDTCLLYTSPSPRDS